MENHMEDNDIPKFCTYRGEIEFEGTLIQADIFIDNKMLEDKNSFLISFLCKSNTIYKMAVSYTHLYPVYPLFLIIRTMLVLGMFLLFRPTTPCS